ncbi:msl0218 [Mesorhizobium japonicum MAFF 303099]|uniref:Msl0218 protein n=1 Tax=Mesorhizobium japonicum (strain LMG 29417 / CECT 9101 / MAFF 303099) TaxID=266835 RepID=Q98NB1_RHILO|nr:msl0218 [Mesorhizobium japonicum MAFF 303099]
MHCVTVSGASETSNVVALQWQLPLMVINITSPLSAAHEARHHKEVILTTACQQVLL